MVLRKKTVFWWRFFIVSGFFSTAFAIMPNLYAQVYISIRKDDFVLCTAIGSAMHFKGVTVTIALTSGKWGIIYTISSQSFYWSLCEPLRDKTKTK